MINHAIVKAVDMLLTLPKMDLEQPYVPIVAELLLKSQKNIIKYERPLYMRTDEWLTPPKIIRVLGPFDLDPCSPLQRPWSTAAIHLTVEDNGLLAPWEGRVWLNPPYARNQIGAWMNRMAMHGNGIAFLFVRTDTSFWHQSIFPYAYSIFFMKGRIRFYTVDGFESSSSGGAPSVLVAYTEYDAEKIEQSDLSGFHALLSSLDLYLIQRPDRSWRLICGSAMSNLGGEANLQDIYEEVKRLAGDKIKKNIHYKAKIRQVLQKHFNNVKRGTWKN